MVATTVCVVLPPIVVSYTETLCASRLPKEITRLCLAVPQAEPKTLKSQSSSETAGEKEATAGLLYNTLMGADSSTTLISGHNISRVPPSCRSLALLLSAHNTVTRRSPTPTSAPALQISELARTQHSACSRRAEQDMRAMSYISRHCDRQGPIFCAGRTLRVPRPFRLAQHACGEGLPRKLVSADGPTLFTDILC